MPFTLREERYARICWTVSGMSRSRNSAANCLPYWAWDCHRPEISRRSPERTRGMTPTTVTTPSLSLSSLSTVYPFSSFWNTIAQTVPESSSSSSIIIPRFL